MTTSCESRLGGLGAARWGSPEMWSSATASASRGATPGCSSARRPREERHVSWRQPPPPCRRRHRHVARASPAGTRVLTSRDRAFDVTYGTVDQLKDISDTQARAFFEPVSPIVDPLLLQYFRADVSVTLDRKYEYLDSRRFAPLVATETRPAGASGRWPASPASETRAKPIVGVVELSIQRDKDIVRCLPVPGEDGAGVPGAVTPWADGLGDGGEMERWAERRAEKKGMRPRPGRWLGGAPADEYAYVSCMCVKDEFRRRGVADTLMEAAEAVTTQWGYDCACLHVFQRNAAAIALYRRRGYEIVDDTCGMWDAMLGKQRYLMVKRLR